jgi:hypothetical protein
MSKAPFKRFIITLLFFNKDVAFIVEKLKTFGYIISDTEVSSIFDDIKSILPESIKDVLSSRQVLDISSQTVIQWLNHFKVFEYYDYIIRKNKSNDGPEYFKWFDDCLWIHEYEDVMTLVNIFLFNGEPHDSISDIVMFKYKKKIGVDALKLYKTIFWDCENLTAKEAYRYCKPFQNSAAIVRVLRSGEAEIEMAPKNDEESSDGSDVPFTFHDSEYIKWKIGYKDIKIPDIKSFLETVKRDSYFKYYESMSMTQSVEREEEDEDGSNDKIGAFDRSLKRKRFRNVEESRAKMAKNWIDIYLKAENAIPNKGEEESKDLMKRLEQVALEYGDIKDEKIVSSDQIPNLLNDIKGDM